VSGARAVSKTKVRAYSLPHSANAGKVAAICAVLPEYQRTLAATQSWQYRRLLSGEGLWNRANPTELSVLGSQLPTG
jgi:hypothetical protein